MIRFVARLRGNERGASALEFALVTPALVLFIIGIAQLGVMFMASAGLRNAVAEGARYATTHPRPTDTQIRNRIASSRFGLNAANLSTVSIEYGVSDSANYADITATYRVTPDFIFFRLPAVTLSETRRAFIHQTS